MLTYDPTLATSNDLAQGWFPPDEYFPTEADYDEMADAQLENADADISMKLRLREQIDRAIAAHEQSEEMDKPPF